MAWMCANPAQEHLDRALFCHYLISTHDYLLVFNGNSENGLITCTDSDWAGSPEDSKSTTGFYIKLANAVFLWNSHQQKTVALSSTEAEYMALSDCSHQVIWIRNMFGEIGFNLLSIPICGDNQGFIFIENNPVIEHHTKHIPSDSITLGMLSKSIKWRSSILKGLTILLICSLRTSDMSNSRNVDLN